MKQNSTPFNVAEYDIQINRTLPFYEEMLQQIVDIVALLDLHSIKWLDVGCGTGKMARSSLGILEIEKMVSIDVELEMLKRAQCFCKDEKLEFLQCDIRELPYQEMFDVVTSIQVNHYFKMDERMTIIENCYNALRENGTYISFENFAPDSEEGTELYLERWKQFQTANGKTEEEADSHIKRFGRNYFPISIPESVRILKDCGFRMVEILWVSYMQVGILARK